MPSSTPTGSAPRSDDDRYHSQHVPQFASEEEAERWKRSMLAELRELHQGGHLQPATTPEESPPRGEPFRALYRRLVPSVLPAGRPRLRLIYAKGYEPGQVGPRSLTRDADCSAAVSAWKSGRATPETHKQLAKCRAMTKTAKQATLQRAAGNEAKAQALEHRVASKGPLTAKARREEAVKRVQARATANQARAERKAGAAQQAEQARVAAAGEPPSLAGSEAVPDRIKEMVRRALNDYREHAANIRRGAEIARNPLVGGGRRYVDDTRSNVGHPREARAFIREFLKVAAEEGIDGPRVLRDLGAEDMRPASTDPLADIRETRPRSRAQEVIAQARGGQVQAEQPNTSHEEQARQAAVAAIRAHRAHPTPETRAAAETAFAHHQEVSGGKDPFAPERTAPLPGSKPGRVGYEPDAFERDQMEHGRRQAEARAQQPRTIQLRRPSPEHRAAVEATAEAIRARGEISRHAEHGPGAVAVKAEEYRRKRADAQKAIGAARAVEPGSFPPRPYRSPLEGRMPEMSEGLKGSASTIDRAAQARTLRAQRLEAMADQQSEWSQREQRQLDRRAEVQRRETNARRQATRKANEEKIRESLEMGASRASARRIAGLSVRKPKLTLSPAGLTPHEEAVLDVLHAEPKGALTPTGDVKEKAGIGYAEAARALMSLAEKGHINLHRHDFPHGMTDAEKRRAVIHKGVHYIGAALRSR